MNNRREFLKLLSAACIAASAGIALTTDQRKLVVRHMRQFSLLDGWHEHRFDVLIDGQMYSVDARSEHAVLTEREIEPMLAVLNKHVRAIHGADVLVSA
jgi:hypothetical protein